MEDNRNQQGASRDQSSQTQNTSSGQSNQQQNTAADQQDQNSQDGSQWNNYQTRELAGNDRSSKQSGESND